MNGEFYLRKICKSCGLCDSNFKLADYYGIRDSCLTREYLKRNNIDITKISGWKTEEILFVINSLFIERYYTLNDLSDSIGRTLNELINLLKTQIKIGNKPMRVKTICQECNKIIIINLSKFLVEGFNFCSKQCYWKYKTHDERNRGENNVRYSSKKMECKNCGIEILVPEFRRKPLNRFGENHVFCSHKCYSVFRSNYYNGEKCYQYGGVDLTEEQRNKIRQKTLSMYENGVFNQVETKPQKIVNTILNELCIEYKREFIIEYYAIDNYLPEHNLMIEVMGDYFHSNPIKYNIFNINDMQKKCIIRDKRKNTYVKKYKDINILYLWENDIIKNKTLCKNLIMLYVKNNGILENYHSFNYHIVDDNVYMNKQILQPLFKQSKSVTTNICDGNITDTPPS